jgi:hypothetical protein
VNALRDNPDSMGTSLDMLRRAANTLNNLSRHPDNGPLFLRHGVVDISPTHVLRFIVIGDLQSLFGLQISKKSEQRYWYY